MEPREPEALAIKHTRFANYSQKFCCFVQTHAGRKEVTVPTPAALNFVLTYGRLLYEDPFQPPLGRMRERH